MPTLAPELVVNGPAWSACQKGQAPGDRQRPLLTSPRAQSSPGSHRAAAQGIANAFRLMAVLHQQCQPALPPGPLPPPFAEEKRPSAGHPGSNMAAPRSPAEPRCPRPPLGRLWGSQRSGGARLGPPWASLGGGPGTLRGARRPQDPRRPSGALGRHTGLVVGPEPCPRPGLAPAQRAPDPGSGLPREASLTPQASSGRTKRSALAVGSTVRSTSRGQGTEGSRGLGPSPMMPPPPPAATGIEAWIQAHSGHCGGQPGAAAQTPKRPRARCRRPLWTAPKGREEAQRGGNTPTRVPGLPGTRARHGLAGSGQHTPDAAALCPFLPINRPRSYGEHLRALSRAHPDNPPLVPGPQ
ncbi:unnamed protein product [Nyctereutes procyonoides]|uniref:(raccoon dog) hypothetical protein n=1 Tax=Nyctereutes procyonoides TaxID=34880 RepID=A0A811XWE9_NYCPR|nr:unnamed protein product [Nyctereutes procyonoides]